MESQPHHPPIRHVLYLVIGIYITFIYGWSRVQSREIIPLPSTKYRNGSMRESRVVSGKHNSDCFRHPKDGRKGHRLYSERKNKKSVSVSGMKVVIA